jgi:hypothetical protein
LTRNFSKWCLSLLLCVLESVRQRKSFPSGKLAFFFFQVFDPRFFFYKNFILH